MITQSNLKELVDYVDGKLIAKINSKCRKAGDALSSLTDKGYLRSSVGGKSYRVHRLVFLYHHGYMPIQVDHIDGNRMNNRIENLRAANRSENQCNRGALANNTSGYPNVSWHKKSKAWLVRVMKDGKTKVNIYVKDLELAGLVALEARSLYHGKFAQLEGTQP